MNDPEGLAKNPTFSIALILAGLALFARLLPWAHVFTDGTIYWYDPDCYVRVRKIWILIENFPRPYVFDYFQGYPLGTGVISTPLMEYLVAVLAFPFHKLAGFEPGLSLVIALLPPLIGTGGVLVFFTMAKRWFGLVPAAISALVLALAAPHVDSTMLGRFDNEMAEAFLFLLSCHFYLKTYDSPEQLRPWLLAGLMAFVYLLVWRGALVPLSIIGLDVLLRIFFSRQAIGEMRLIAVRSAALYLLMAGLAAMVCLTDVWGTGELFTYNIVSRFHVLLFALAATIPLLLGHVLDQPLGSSRKKHFGYALLALVALALAWKLAQNIVSGMVMIGGGSAWIETIAQYQRPGWPVLFQVYGPLVLLSPLALSLLVSSIFDKLACKRFFILLTLILLALSLFKLRFALYVGIAAGLGVAIVFRFILAAGPLHARLSALAISVVLVALWPNVAQLQYLYQNPRALVANGDIGDALDWLRTQTPSAGNALKPDHKPEYGVLSRWDYSGWIQTLALRPSVTTLFGTEAPGMQAAARFFLASDEIEMGKVLSSNGVRFIVLDKMMGDLGMYASLIGDTRTLFSRQWDPVNNREMMLPTAQAFSLIWSRLYFSDGNSAATDSLNFKPVEGVRLVYESPTATTSRFLPWEIKKIKIFEYRNLPQLTVRGKPGQEVSLAQPVETNQGRRFSYRISKTLGTDGLALFSLPYGEKVSAKTTGSVGPALVAAGPFLQEIPLADLNQPNHSITLP